MKIHRHMLRSARTFNPDFAKIVRANGAMELTKGKPSRFFELLARASVNQQLSTSAAQTIWGRVEALRKADRAKLIDTLSESNHEKLRACGISRNKLKAIYALGAGILDKSIKPRRLRDASYEDVKTTITSLWGFGPWTADMVAISYCAMPDIFPDTDVAVVRGLASFYNDKRTPAEAAEHFQPYRTYLARHIWKGINTGLIR